LNWKEAEKAAATQGAVCKASASSSIYLSSASPWDVIAASKGGDQACFLGGQIPNNLAPGAILNCFTSKERNISFCFHLLRLGKRTLFLNDFFFSPQGFVWEMPQK
jgi:hypothetical protein